MEQKSKQQNNEVDPRAHTHVYLRIRNLCAGRHLFGRFARARALTYSSDADERGDVNVDGGEFTGCHSSGNGGFLFVSDGAVANITGGTVTKNVAGRRAGVVSDDALVSRAAGGHICC